MSRDRADFCLSVPETEVDVEFRTREESPVDPPNPDYLRVHVAIAKVLYLSEAADHMQSVVWEVEYEGALSPNGETDFATYLWSKLLTL